MVVLAKVRASGLTMRPKVKVRNPAQARVLAEWGWTASRIVKVCQCNYVHARDVRSGRVKLLVVERERINDEKLRAALTDAWLEDNGVDHGRTHEPPSQVELL